MNRCHRHRAVAPDGVAGRIAATLALPLALVLVVVLGCSPPVSTGEPAPSLTEGTGAPAPAPAEDAALSPELSEAIANSVDLAVSYLVTPDVTYRRVGTWNGRLDVYVPRGTTAPIPTVVFFHGGGWIQGSKEASVLALAPYLQLGWAVVNVEYRLADRAAAPAALEDADCAVRWVAQNAGRFNFDARRIVLTGQSAGSHLALMLGLLAQSEMPRVQCPDGEPYRPIAIVNWYGPTDLFDLLDEDQLPWVKTWVGVGARGDLARQLSPLAWVRSGVPPVVSIHGDADDTVPYLQSVRLHESLDAYRVTNRLITIPGGQHGDFEPTALAGAFDQVLLFLENHVPGVDFRDRPAAGS